jgi:hypothetical protein
VFGTNTVQLECRVPSKCEGTGFTVQDGTKTVWLWLFSGLIFPGAHPPDATSDSTSGATSGRTKDGEVDQSISEASSGVKVPFHWRFLCLAEMTVSLDRGLPVC